MDPAGKDGNDSRICVRGMHPAGKDGNDSRSAARDGSPPRRRHQPKRRSPAPGTESPMPRWQCPDGTLVPARHKIQLSEKGTSSAGRVAAGTGEFCCPLFQMERTARSHRAASPHPPHATRMVATPAPFPGDGSGRRKRSGAPLGSGALRQGGTTGRRAGRLGGSSRILVWEAPAGVSVGKGRVSPAACVGGAALSNLRSQSGR
ncbi:unnamed protein product [Coccothraustes coccothraustes]